MATMPIDEVREILKRSGMPRLTNAGKALSAELS
jgi:hypothetical protein